MKKLGFLFLGLCFLFVTSCNEDNVTNTVGKLTTQATDTEGEFTTKILFYSNYGIVNTPIKKVDVYVNDSFVGEITNFWLPNNEPDCDNLLQGDAELDRMCILRLNKKMAMQNEKIKYYARAQSGFDESRFYDWKEVEMDIKSDTCYKILLDIRKVFEK